MKTETVLTIPDILVRSVGGKDNNQQLFNTAAAAFAGHGQIYRRNEGIASLSLACRMIDKAGTAADNKRSASS